MQPAVSYTVIARFMREHLKSADVLGGIWIGWRTLKAAVQESAASTSFLCVSYGPEVKHPSPVTGVSLGNEKAHKSQLLGLKLILNGCFCRTSSSFLFIQGVVLHCGFSIQLVCLLPSLLRGWKMSKCSDFCNWLALAMSFVFKQHFFNYFFLADRTLNL